MKVLYSTQGVVEFDGHHYYSNPVQATYKRYLTLGEDITVLSYMKHVDKPQSDLVDEGAVKFVFVKKVNTLKGMLKREGKADAAKIEMHVRESDVCVCHVPCAHSYLVIKYARKYNKPYMTVVVGCPWDSLWNYDWRGKLLSPGAYFSLKRIQKNAPYSIYVTNEFLQNRYPTNGKHVGCSNVNVHTGVSGVLEKRMTIIAKRKENGSLLKIGTAAALDVPYKGQEFVIRALAKLKKENINFEYHLIGIGSDMRLRTIAKKEDVMDRIFFHGSLPHAEVLDFMDDMDIYIQPSKQEGLPRATIEAMSRGCLCIGSKIAGIPELLEPDYLFSKGNVNQIANILRRINYDTLLEQSKRNYNEAKKYDCDLLNKRRTQFIEQFKNKIFNPLKVLLVPGNTDQNRGDQALVWESIRLIQEIYDTPEITLMRGLEADLYKQTNALGFPFVINIMPHPARIFKNYNHVRYTKKDVILMGMRAILDFFLLSLLLIRCRFINKIGLMMIPKACGKTYDAFKQSDAVYVKGGGFIHSYGAISDPYQIFYLLYSVLLAIRFKKEIVILPNSIGPLKNKLAKALALYVLNHCKYISVRETVSEQFLLSQKSLHTKVFRHFDLGYFLEPAIDFDSIKYLKKQGVDTEKPIVGITLRPYRFPGEDNPEKKYKDYIDGFVGFIEYLNLKKYQVVLFSHTLGPGAHENDTIAIEEVSNALKKQKVNHICIIDSELDCRQVMSIYSNFDYLVGTRFHSVIFAQNSNVPTIAVSYGGNKGVGIMEDVGLSEFTIPMNSISKDQLVQMFNKIEESKKNVIKRLLEHRNRLVIDRERMIKEISMSLNIR